MTVNIDKQWFVDLWTEKGLSLRKVAALIGMDPGALSRALNGGRGIKVDEVGKIATVLGVSRAEVLEHLGGEDTLKAGVAKDVVTNDRYRQFGFMKGLLTVEEGYDLTSPSDEDWHSGYLGEDRLNG